MDILPWHFVSLSFGKIQKIADCMICSSDSTHTTQLNPLFNFIYVRMFLPHSLKLIQFVSEPVQLFIKLLHWKTREMCPESTRPFSLPWGGDLTHAVSLWCYCYCRRLCIATCLGSMCFPLLEWSPCLVASWVIASPIWETQRRQQKENRKGCTSKKERDWKTGQGSRKTGRQITWWMRDETGRVSEKDLVFPSYLSSWATPAWTVIRRGAGWPWQTKPSLGHAVMCSSVARLLCQHSQRDSVTPDRYRPTGWLGLILIQSMITSKERRGENWYFPTEKELQPAQVPTPRPLLWIDTPHAQEWHDRALQWVIFSTS